MVEVDTAAVLADLIGKAKAMLLLKSEFNRAWIRFWFNHVSPCDEATFYRLLPIYRGFVDQFVFRYKRADVGVKHASWELFRQISPDEGSWTWDDAAGFVKFYEQLDNRLGRALAHLFDFHGDSYSDLCDSLPLAGEAIVRRCLASDPKSRQPRREGFLEERELRDAVKELGPQWSKFILEGENYVLMALLAACKKDWLYELLVDRENKHAWSEKEQEELSYANHGDE
jgi:hypothetical protein